LGLGRRFEHTSTRAARRSTTTMLRPSLEMAALDAVSATLHVCVSKSSTLVSGTPAEESPPPVMYHLQHKPSTGFH
jgi:hypothetical protein